MDAATRRLVHELSADGESNRAIAKRLGVTHPTIAKVLAETPPPAPAPRRKRKASDDPQESPIDPSASALDIVRDLLAAGRKDLADARSIGDSTTAQRLTRDCAGLSVALARLEKQEPEDGSIVIRSGEVREIEEALAERFGAIVTRANEGGGLLCARCHRSMAIELAQVEGMGVSGSEDDR